MPPPSAGGIMLVELLKLFQKEELKKLGYQSGAYQHLLAEGMRGAIADRMRHLGDPDHQTFDLSRLLSDSRLAKRRASISAEKTRKFVEFGLESHGTHHLNTRDSEGNMVALTTTVNRLFGAKLVARKSGIILNDELDDFTSLSEVVPFGMIESPNRPRPLARPMSSMTPTIVVKAGRAILGLGGSGGTAIATNVSQLTLAQLVFGRSPAQAVSDRRFYVPTQGATLLLEPGAGKALSADLKERGETLGEMTFLGTAVQMIAVENGRARAASDPRKHGQALVD
jgi:gamma-glutamyltranspeptidase/glutathione hydrolase